MFLHYLCRKNTSMQSRNILNIKILYIIISFLYFVIIESYRKIYPLIPRGYILYVFEICILYFTFHRVFFLCFDWKTESFKNFLHLFRQNVKLKFWEYFCFFFRENREKIFCFRVKHRILGIFVFSPSYIFAYRVFFFSREYF